MLSLPRFKILICLTVRFAVTGSLLLIFQDYAQAQWGQQSQNSHHPKTSGFDSFGYPSDPQTGAPAKSIFTLSQQRPLRATVRQPVQDVPSLPNQQGQRAPGPPQLPGSTTQPDAIELEMLPPQSVLPSQDLDSNQQGPFTRRPVVIPNDDENLDELLLQTSPIESSVGGSDFAQPLFDQPAVPAPGAEAPTYFVPQSYVNRFMMHEGFREGGPIDRRGQLDDYGQRFDFEEKKKDYPPFSEILATGRYFGHSELLYVKPFFQNNTALTVEGLGQGRSESFDFAHDSASRFRFGFESKYGPGIELNYFQYDHQSRASEFTSDGRLTGETSVWMAGPSRWTRIAAANLGETLQAEHSLEVQNLGVAFFKDWKLPISRLGGGFGIQYVSIAQDLQSVVTNSLGTEIGRISSRHDFRAFGPKLAFEYYRPVGHTHLEIIGGFSGAVLFGNRDQFISNTAASDFSRIGSDEFLTILDVVGGLQYVRHTADQRTMFARVTLLSQSWIGGGTAVDPQGNLGFRGVGFAFGFNR